MRWLGARLELSVPAQRVTTTGLVHDAVAADSGLGLLPCFIGDEDQRLSRVTPPIEELAAEYWMIIPPESAQFPYLRRAIDWVADSFRDNAVSLLG